MDRNLTNGTGTSGSHAASHAAQGLHRCLPGWLAGCLPTELPNLMIAKAEVDEVQTQVREQLVARLGVDLR